MSTNWIVWGFNANESLTFLLLLTVLGKYLICLETPSIWSNELGYLLRSALNTKQGRSQDIFKRGVTLCQSGGIHQIVMSTSTSCFGLMWHVSDVVGCLVKKGLQRGGGRSPATSGPPLATPLQSLEIEWPVISIVLYWNDTINCCFRIVMDCTGIRNYPHRWWSVLVTRELQFHGTIIPLLHTYNICLLYTSPSPRDA